MLLSYGCNSSHEFHRVHRFGEINICTAFVTDDFVPNHAARGRNDNADFWMNLSKFFYQYQSVCVWKIQIDHINIGCEITRLVQYFGRQTRASRKVPFSLKKRYAPLTKIIVVFHDQDFQCKCHL